MKEQTYDLAKFDKVIADVGAVKDAGNFIPDMSTKDGYEASKRFVLDNTAPMKKALEKAHKEIKAPFWDACKMLDGKKKELLVMIEDIEAPHKDAYKLHDAEIKRKKEEAERAVQTRLDWFDDVLNFSFNATSEQIEKALEDCQDYEMDFDFFGKRIVEAQEKQADTIGKLTERLTQQVMFEQSEKQRLDFESKQRELEEREAKLLAAEKEKQDAINLEVELKERAEREAKQKEERKQSELNHQKQMEELAEKQEADRLEREAQIKLQAEKEEAERLERESQLRKSRTKNRNEAAKQLMELTGITKEQAIEVCNEIALNKVVFLTSNF